MSRKVHLRSVITPMGLIGVEIHIDHVTLMLIKVLITSSDNVDDFVRCVNPSSGDE